MQKHIALSWNTNYSSNLGGTSCGVINCFKRQECFCTHCNGLPNDFCSYFHPRYLVKNASALFSASDYEVAPPEYHRKAV